MPDPKMSQAEVAAEVARRQAANKAQFIKDRRKDRLRALASETLGKRVHDIIELEDANGDDVIVWVYTAPFVTGKRDISQGERCVVMIVNLEQSRQSVSFDEVTFRDGRYWLGEENFIIKLQTCDYTY
jgi:hypothetical protein